jgi:N-methylhydantoinase B
MLASLRTGGLRTRDIIERHGVETFVTCQEDLQAYSALKARAVLRRVPDGVYEFWDFMDDDLVSRIPIRLRVKMTVADGEVHLDFSGTDPEVKAAYNIATFDRFHEWLTMRFTSFLCTNDKTIVINAGLYRPFTMTNPRGSVLNAEFPAAVGLRSAPARRLNDAITGAILKAAPEMISAPTPGAGMTFVLAEYDAQGAKPTVGVLQPMRGGMGGFNGRDGVDCRDATMSNMSNHSLEFVEADSGVLFHEYDIRPDSGGPGRWRGGVGQMLTVEILRDGAVIIPRGMERLRFPAWGAVGGKPAQPYRCILNKGRADEKLLPKLDSFAIKKGDTVTMMMPGAGGYGDPYLRDTALVNRDVAWGFVGRRSAERDYGVIVADEGTVDEEATRRTRASRVKDNVRAGFDFGPEREAWEAVFDDATMGEICRRVMALPRSARWETRHRLFMRAVPDLPLAGDTPTLAHVLSDADAVRARLFRAMEEILPQTVERAAE